MREYVIVLHLHKSPASAGSLRGPTYDDPGGRGGMVTAVRDESEMGKTGKRKTITHYHCRMWFPRMPQLDTDFD